MTFFILQVLERES